MITYFIFGSSIIAIIFLIGLIIKLGLGSALFILIEAILEN